MQRLDAPSPPHTNAPGVGDTLALALPFLAAATIYVSSICFGAFT